MTDLKDRNKKRRKVFVKTPGGATKTRHLAKKPSKAKCAETGQELHGIPRQGATNAKNSPKTSRRPERPYGGVLSSSAARNRIKSNTRAQDTGDVSGSDMFKVGRICVKTAGRDAGLKCVVVEVHEDGLTIDGQTRRRKVSKDHVEPLGQTAKLKKGASHSEVKKALSKLNIEVRDTKTKSKKKKAKEKSDKKKKSSEDEKTPEKKDSEKEIPSESQIRSMTKDDMKEYAKKEFGIELSTNNLKDEMVENFLKELKK